MRTFAAVMLLSGVVFAEPPVAGISGPEKGRPGDILILSASEADHVDWLVDSSDVAVPVEDAAAKLEETAEALRAAGFTVEPPATNAPPVYLELDGGKRLLLASYPGTYRVSLAVGNADGVDQTSVKVVVSGGKPPKPDDPDPPTPEPAIPVGKFGLGIKSWRAAQGVRSSDRASEAKQLATALLLSLAATDGQAMLDQFASTMKSKFTESQKQAWEPWRSVYLAELTALQAAGKLKERGDWAAAFTEFALGLSAVAE